MKVGVLGAGQLGRMLALAGYPLGFDFTFYDPSPNPCAKSVGKLISASFDDQASLSAFAKSVDVVTYEFENVPAKVAALCAEHAPVYPPASALDVAQHRGKEKDFFRSCEIPTPAYKVVTSKEELIEVLTTWSLPAVIKTTTQGYDGKGQKIVKQVSEAAQTWEELGCRELIVEEFIKFECELSAVAVRATSGEIEAYPLARNIHKGGILHRSEVPGISDSQIQEQGRKYISAILERLSYVGVCALELFLLPDGRLLANEMAPRVHNSGHWSMDGAVTSQFENHLRAITKMPLGSAAARAATIMYNLIGNHAPIEELLSVTELKVHLYGKSPRPGRKLGHVNFCANSVDELRAIEKKVLDVLRI